jgi:hypothetical protein
MCQLKYMSELGQKSSLLESLYAKLRRKLIQIYSKALFLKKRTLSRLAPINRDGFLLDLEQPQIYPGDIVRVRLKKEINSLLDSHGKYKSCPFMEEMYSFCEKEYKVLTKVNYFFDESKQKLLKCQDLFILDGPYCSGKRWLYSESCDLRCFFFWHRDLLTRV